MYYNFFFYGNQLIMAQPTTRRDKLLHIMGIEQWQLRHPTLLKGVITMHFPPSIKLIIVQRNLAPQTKLFKDILVSLQLTSHEYLLITPEQLPYVEFKTLPDRCVIWLLSSEQKEIDQLQQLAQNTPIPCWQSPDWSVFCQQPQAKKQFWHTALSFLIQQKSN